MLLDLLLALSSEDSPVGVMAAGMKLDFLTNSSKAWEVWERLMLNRERAAARIYLGTDGTLGATGGAPGVDITQLFGVATTRLQGDIQTITDGFQTGTIEPWTAINFGDSSLAPYRAYLLPDPDDQKTREDYAARQTKLQELIKAARENGFAVTQEYVNELASKLNVEPPMLASQTTTTSAFFAYELDGGIVTIDEVRASKGLPSLADGKGLMTVPEAKALAQSASNPANPTPPSQE
jgi:hypothetical protein